jgi:hypothetical protein
MVFGEAGGGLSTLSSLKPEAPCSSSGAAGAAGGAIGSCFPWCANTSHTSTYISKLATWFCISATFCTKAKCNTLKFHHQINVSNMVFRFYFLKIN